VVGGEHADTCRNASGSPIREHHTMVRAGLELGKHAEETGHCAAGERHEADAELAELVQRDDQVGERPSPAIEAPNQDGIDLAAPTGLE